MGLPSNSHIPRIGKVKAGERIKASHINAIARAVRGLTERGIEPFRPTTTGGAGFRHPFKLSVVRESSQNRMYVEFGCVNVPDQTTDTNTDVIPFSLMRSPTMSNGSDPLQNDPDGGTAGYEVLSTSTTYGVWMRIDCYAELVDLTGQTGTAGLGAANAEWYDEAWMGPYGSSNASTCRIVVDSSNTTPGSAATKIGAGSGYTYFYIGQVAIDANDVATIKQFRRTDIDVPIWMLPTAFEVSTDSDNSLKTGVDTGDGRLWVRVVSGDADNDITAGTDGGAYYDAP